VIHTTLAGIKPTTFRLLVRRATSRATETTSKQRRVLTGVLASIHFISRMLSSPYSASTLSKNMDWREDTWWLEECNHRSYPQKEGSIRLQQLPRYKSSMSFHWNSVWGTSWLQTRKRNDRSDLYVTANSRKMCGIREGSLCLLYRI